MTRTAQRTGEPAVAATSDEINEIQEQMAQIRRELHQDVREVVAGAEAATDWRRYVRAYPWAAVGIAMAGGYLLVPRARKAARLGAAGEADLEAIRALAEQARQATAAGKEPVKKSLVGAAVAMLAPLAWRLAQDYAVAYLEQWLLHQQQQQRAQAGPRPGGAEAPGRAPSPGGRTGGHAR
jgi:ElaB/YqjD/DUF883 family membrane-anchored ribosome-binding protein